jgi:hypothetical protein
MRKQSTRRVSEIARYNVMTETKAREMVATAYLWITGSWPVTPRFPGTDRYVNSGASTILAKAEQCIGTGKTVIIRNGVIQYA